MLIIDNRTQETLITMRECIEVQEDAFRKLAEGVAAHRPRIDVYVPCASDDSYYRWGSMEGAYNGIYACRVKSDIVSWPSRASGQTEEWHCIRPGTYCGLILLFSTDNGEPLAILNDGTIQHVRVGGGRESAPSILQERTLRRLACLVPAVWLEPISKHFAQCGQFER